MDLRDSILSQRSDIVALAERYGITNVQLFGSVARGTDGPDSDIDLLIDPVLPVQDGFGFLKFQAAVSDLLHRKVDVVFTSGIFPPMRESILKDAVKL